MMKRTARSLPCVIVIVLITFSNARCSLLDNVSEESAPIKNVSIDSTKADSNKESSGNKIKLTVFYETLCPDSMDFFTDQLPSLFNNKTKLYRRVKFDLVPYGHAKTQYNESSKSYTFTCQHGPQECKYNKLHACILSDLYTAKKHCEVNRLVPLLYCLMKVKEESELLDQCGKKYNVPVEPYKKCLSNSSTDELLAKLGNRTHEFKPSVKWVPMAVINDKYNYNDFEMAQTDLKGLVCKYLKPKPRTCNSTV